MTDQEVILDLKKPLENILSELLPGIEAGTYSTFVGDDSAGRVPTIILANVARHIYRKKGFPDPVVRFIAGSTGLSGEGGEKKQNALIEQIARIQNTVQQNQDPKKVLIVTDTISTGTSIEFLSNAFIKNGWPVDVVTVGEHENASLEMVAEDIGTRIISGSGEVPELYWRKELTGVTKDPKTLFAVPHPNADDERVRQGRAVAHEVAKELIELYEKGQLKGEAEVYGE